MKTIARILLVCTFISLFSFILYDINIIESKQNGNSEELLIFIEQNNSLISKDFKQNYLPAIKTLAKKENISYKIIDIKDGCPKTITKTPTIVYQNYKARNYFIGRYNQISKIANFIRTSRVIPQEDANNIKDKILIWENQRTTIASPIKVTNLSGHLPKGFDQDQFIIESKEIIYKATQNYRLNTNYNLDRNARSFYMNFYPYLSEDNTLSISLEIFSQFSCVEPIYVNFSNPVQGNFSKRKALFTAATQILEKEIARLIDSSKNGDGFNPVSSNTNNISWDIAALKLPPKPKKEGEKTKINFVLGTKWQIEGPIAKGMPMLQFHFKAPVDNYTGEIKELKGQFNLQDDLLLAGMQGKFETTMNTLTMGDESLDASVFEETKTKEFPIASFNITKALPTNKQSLKFNQTNTLNIEGEFSFMGKNIPVLVNAQLEPFINEANQVRLLANASFKINVKNDFNLETPDGPRPNNEIVEIYLNFVLKSY